MLVFIDESGDAGLKLDKGSSKYFVVVLVAFEDNADAQATDSKIETLRPRLGIGNREFHFNSLSASHRKRFLAAVAQCNFFYFAIVINKQKLTGKGFRYKESFYKYTCGLVFENAKPYLNNATVVIDGSGTKDFRKQLGAYLRKRVSDDSGRCLVKKVKMQDSHGNNLLQLADMVSGAVARSYTRKPDARDCRNLIKHREIYVQFWPK